MIRMDSNGQVPAREIGWRHHIAYEKCKNTDGMANRIALKARE